MSRERNRGEGRGQGRRSPRGSALGWAGTGLLALLLLLLGAVFAVDAQEPEAGAGELGPPVEEVDDPSYDDDEIQELLEGEEEILAGEGFSYDAGSRRDPFKSLLQANEASEFEGPRPEGIPGLLIDEILITGIFRTDDGYVAQVQSAERERSYLLKQGDQLFDGDVVQVNPQEVVFKQIVQDPTALKPFREVVKSLNPPGA